MHVCEREIRIYIFGERDMCMCGGNVLATCRGEISANILERYVDKIKILFSGARVGQDRFEDASQIRVG